MLRETKTGVSRRKRIFTRYVVCRFQNIENFMKDVYKDRYGEDISDDSVKRLYSVAVSIFAIGGMLGGFSGGIIANRFGRFVPEFCNFIYE